MSGCVSPTLITNPKTKSKMLVPCGHCYPCRMVLRAEWTFRLTVEQFCWPLTSFLTLTYDEDNLPLVSGCPSLYPLHLSKFIKSLRNDKLTCRYYAVGEYGGKFGRPHYHVILFHSQIIYPNNYWHYGNVHEYSAQIGGLHYVGKHHIVAKRRDVPDNEPVEPFSRMSKGLGSSYLDGYVSEVTGEIDDMPFFIAFNGYHYPLPRYYRKKLLQPYEGEFTFASDKIDRLYPNLTETQKVEVLKQLQLASIARIKDYNNQIR